MAKAAPSAVYQLEKLPRAERWLTLAEKRGLQRERLSLEHRAHLTSASQARSHKRQARSGSSPSQFSTMNSAIWRSTESSGASSSICSLTRAQTRMVANAMLTSA